MKLVAMNLICLLSGGPPPRPSPQPSPQPPPCSRERGSAPCQPRPRCTSSSPWRSTQREGRLDALNRLVPADVLQIVHHAVLCDVKRCLDRRERCVELALLFVLPRHAHGQRRQRILLPGHRGGSQEGHSEKRCGTHACGNS